MKKKLFVGFAGSLMLVTVAFAAPKDSTYTGEIMDGSCAKNTSHEMMVKKEGMGDAADPKVRKMCSQGCVKMSGSKYVLYNKASKAVYQLDDQAKPADFAGGNVKITGTLDKATKTIHITSIEAAP